jgi:hypothetical protein
MERDNAELIEFQLSSLLLLTWITITSIGEENIYFTTCDGARGFVKVL